MIPKMTMSMTTRRGNRDVKKRVMGQKGSKKHVINNGNDDDNNDDDVVWQKGGKKRVVNDGDNDNNDDDSVKGGSSLLLSDEVVT
jgi:hypothetical protein